MHAKGTFGRKNQFVSDQAGGGSNTFSLRDLAVSRGQLPAARDDTFRHEQYRRAYQDAEWNYDCWNILDRFDEVYPGERNPGQPIYMYRFDIPFTHIHDVKHSYIDELRFSSEPINIYREPALPASDFIFDRLDTIDSWQENSWNYFHLNFMQFGCPTNRFPLLGIESATPGVNCTLQEINSTDKWLIQEYLANENNSQASFHCDDWHNETKIEIKRTSKMSLAMQGSYELIFENTSIHVPIYTSKHDLYPIVDSN